MTRCGNAPSCILCPGGSHRTALACPDAPGRSEPERSNTAWGFEVHHGEVHVGVGNQLLKVSIVILRVLEVNLRALRQPRGRVHLADRRVVLTELAAGLDALMYESWRDAVGDRVPGKKVAYTPNRFPITVFNYVRLIIVPPNAGISLPGRLQRVEPSLPKVADGTEPFNSSFLNLHAILPRLS
eukprot:9503817-Pyramimonas_sp.AAC.7